MKTTDPAYRKLRRSLEAFGLVEPLVWNERTGHVVGGHARLRILRELGVTEVPVSVVQLDAAREKALNIVLNNQEAQGTFDPKRLGELLTELEPLPELELTGFDLATLERLRMEPEDMDVQPTDAIQGDAIEILLEIPRSRYDAVAPRLNTLIEEFDLISHTREQRSR